MTILDTPINDDNFSGDMIRPFQLESSNIRGRIVRFNQALDEIVTPHNYPDAVNTLLGETVTICALLSSLMKFEGIFTLQISGDGPVKMIVADMTSKGHIRGCATFKKDEIPHDDKVTFINQSTELLGKGYMAFTVDQGLKVERYQGIVELKGETLTDSIQHYFVQSEQIETGMVLAVGRVEGQWRASGIILQQMPQEGGFDENHSQVASQVASKSEEEEENWQRTMILLQSCKREELLSDDLNSHDILTRLFHEEGVRVFQPTHVDHKCRCSQERVQNVYDMLSEEEQQDVVVDGKIEMTCDFCSKTYTLKQGA